VQEIQEQNITGLAAQVVVRLSLHLGLVGAAVWIAMFATG